MSLFWIFHIWYSNEESRYRYCCCSQYLPVIMKVKDDVAKRQKESILVYTKGNFRNEGISTIHKSI